jgi:hypothetical protein
MVVFVDLDDAFGGSVLEKPFQLKVDPISEPAELPPSPTSSDGSEVPNPNRNGFSAALSCYPCVFADCGVLTPANLRLD